MENNTFFGAVLRGLGFQVYSAGARVSHAVESTGGGGYSGWYVYKLFQFLKVGTMGLGIAYEWNVRDWRWQRGE